MKPKQKEILNNIQKIQQHQGVLQENPRNCQQQFFHVFAQRQLLNKQVFHQHIDEVLEYLPGSFSITVLKDLYATAYLQIGVEIDIKDIPIFRRIMKWLNGFQTLKKERIIPLLETVAPEHNNQTFDNYEEYLTFINLIASDLVRLIKGPARYHDEYSHKYIKAADPDDLLSFLLGSLPKILYNIILPHDSLPPEQKQQHQTMQILYRVPSLEYFVRSKGQYGTLIKFFVKMLLNFDLKKPQQKIMMEIVFRYFYAYHYDKRYEATDIFNKLSQSVRFSLGDEFVLFFKIARKIGKNNFVEFLLRKSEWLHDINSRVSPDNSVGYIKENLTPFSGFRLPEVIQIPHGKVQHRWFQVLQDYSLCYFQIAVFSKDITFRLFYLGGFTEQKPSKTEIFSFQRTSGVVKTNIMAVQRGIYMLQFDNSYSWINPKTVKFEKVVLAPVQFQFKDQLSWLSSFYDNIPFNKMGEKKQVIWVRKASQIKTEIYEGKGNITKRQGWYNLKMDKGNDMYEFETQSEDKLVYRFAELIEENGKIKWMIAGEPLEDTSDLKKILQDNTKTLNNKGEKEPQILRQMAEIDDVRVQLQSPDFNLEQQREEQHEIIKQEKKNHKE